MKTTIAAALTTVSLIALSPSADATSLPSVTIQSVPDTSADISFSTSAGVTAGCSTCFTVTNPSVPGAFSLTIGTVSTVPVIGSGATQDESVYKESYSFGSISSAFSRNLAVPTPAPATVNVSGDGYSASAGFSQFQVFAAPGSNSAVIQLDLTSVSVDGIPFTYPGTAYLTFAGTTNGAVMLSGGNFQNFSIDWTGGLSLNSYTPPAVPLPASSWLVLSGLAGMGLLARRRPAVGATQRE